MTVGDVLVFLEKLQRDEFFKKKIREAKTDQEVEKIVGEAGFVFTAEEFYILATEIQDVSGLDGSQQQKQFSFCEGCSDKGTSFCLTNCFWSKV